eukprot:718854-Rhodomonas_salina.2
MVSISYGFTVELLEESDKYKFVPALNCSTKNKQKARPPRAPWAKRSYHDITKQRFSNSVFLISTRVLGITISNSIAVWHIPSFIIAQLNFPGPPCLYAQKPAILITYKASAHVIYYPGI